VNTFSFTVELIAPIADILAVMIEKDCILLSLDRRHDCYVFIYMSKEKYIGFPGEL